MAAKKKHPSKKKAASKSKKKPHSKKASKKKGGSKGHIPIKVLEHRLARLGQIIAKRTGKKASRVALVE